MFRINIKFSLYFPEVFELSFHLLKFQNITSFGEKTGCRLEITAAKTTGVCIFSEQLSEA